MSFGTPSLFSAFTRLCFSCVRFRQSLAVVQQIEKLLDTFHERMGSFASRGADMSAFDDFDTSGIAGTTMQDTLNFEAARWLARRIPRDVEIAWDDYEEERAMGSTWPRFIPLLSEDADVEANIPWRKLARRGERARAGHRVADSAI